MRYTLLLFTNISQNLFSNPLEAFTANVLMRDCASKTPDGSPDCHSEGRTHLTFFHQDIV